MPQKLFRQDWDELRDPRGQEQDVQHQLEDVVDLRWDKMARHFLIRDLVQG